MKNSPLRITLLAVAVALLLVEGRLIQAKFAHRTPLDLIETSLMGASLWEPAGDLLSARFVGTDDRWINDRDVWTLPGEQADRQLVQHKGCPRPNHQQFTVKTTEQWHSFHLRLDFRFDPTENTETAVEQCGNSGIYIFGLYEVQLLDTSRFLPCGAVPEDRLYAGRIGTVLDGRSDETAANKCLCGSIYGGGLAEDPIAGATTDAAGGLYNYCKPSGQWNRLDIYFVPARFKNGRKTHQATVAVKINGQRVHFAGKDRYGIPGPTGSQRGKAETASGPIVIQDHGGRLSFRGIQMDPTWKPHPGWAVSAASAFEHLAQAAPAR